MLPVIVEVSHAHGAAPAQRAQPIDHEILIGPARYEPRAAIDPHTHARQPRRPLDARHARDQLAARPRSDQAVDVRFA
jgi:hypothetical protein